MNACGPSHHNACACREARFAEIEAKNTQLLMRLSEYEKYLRSLLQVTRALEITDIVTGENVADKIEDLMSKTFSIPSGSDTGGGK